MCCRIRHCPASNSQFTDIIIAHDGRADSFKAIAQKPIVVHVDAELFLYGFYMLYFWRFLFSSDQQKNIAQLNWLIVVKKIDVG